MTTPHGTGSVTSRKGKVTARNIVTGTDLQAAAVRSSQRPRMSLARCVCQPLGAAAGSHPCGRTDAMRHNNLHSVGRYVLTAEAFHRGLIGIGTCACVERTDQQIRGRGVRRPLPPQEMPPAVSRLDRPK
jgi:hypothetical protein